MDWNKAKNYTIIFLFLLNALLIGLNFKKDQQYVITSDQKKSITTVLSENNVVINTDIPEEFVPIGQLYMKPYNYDVLKLQKIFFGDVSEVKRTEEFEKTILTYNKKSLVIANNIVSFRDNIVDNNIEFSKSYAVKRCSNIISAIENNYTKMYMDTYSVNSDVISLRYIQKFNGYNIFNNVVIFKVYKSGIIECEFTYNEPIEIKQPKLDICSADEALFTFMNEIKDIYGDERVFIKKIDFGYLIDDNSDLNTNNIVSVPHYRIFTENIEQPFYINAYNNTMQ